jgi:hypothetical protein
MTVSTDAILFYGYCWNDQVDRDDVFGPNFFDQYHAASLEPVAVDLHCSDEYPIPYLYVPESRITAYRGLPQRLFFDEANYSQDVAHEWNQRLEAFTFSHGIDLSEAGGPGWWMVSWWG